MTLQHHDTIPEIIIFEISQIPDSSGQSDLGYYLAIFSELCCAFMGLATSIFVCVFFFMRKTFVNVYYGHIVYLQYIITFFFSFWYMNDKCK